MKEVTYEQLEDLYEKMQACGRLGDEKRGQALLKEFIVADYAADHINDCASWTKTKNEECGLWAVGFTLRRLEGSQCAVRYDRDLLVDGPIFNCPKIKDEDKILLYDDGHDLSFVSLRGKEGRILLTGRDLFGKKSKR